MFNKGKVYISGPSSDIEVRKDWTFAYIGAIVVSSIGILNVIMLPILSIVDLYYIFFAGVAGLASCVGIAISSQGLNDQQEVKRIFSNRIMRYVKTSRKDSESLQKHKKSAINAVMNCGHEMRFGQKAVNQDDNGNCKFCKKEFALIVNDDVNDYIENELNKAIEKADYADKQALRKTKAEDDKIESAHTKSLVGALENPENIESLKRSRYVNEALKEISH